MTEEQFKKLQKSVNEIELSVKTTNCLNILYITTLIQVYATQEDQGGYCKDVPRGKTSDCWLLRPRNRGGLLCGKGFGRKSLLEVEKKLKQLKLPPLKEGPKVMREFLSFPFMASGLTVEKAHKKAARFFTSLRPHWNVYLLDRCFGS